MCSCIILKKDLEKLAKKLMKEFYDTIHDEYMIGEFEEFKLQRKYYEENLTKEFLSFHKDKKNRFLYFDNKRYKDLVKMETKDLLTKIEDKIKDKTLDFNIIYNFLVKMDKKLETKIDKNIEYEIDEDLCSIKQAFLKIYEVYDHDYHYLED